MPSIKTSPHLGPEKVPFERLRRGIGTSQVVFFVVAGAAPLVSMLGAAPVAMTHGNGVGMPGAFLMAGLLLLVFSVGYAAMSRHVAAGGGFFTYTAVGLGSAAGVGSMAVAIVSYTAIQSAVYGLLGYFCVLILNPALGVGLEWWVYTGFAIATVHVLGTRSIELNGKLLGVLMMLEAGILLLLALVIVVTGGGPDGLTPAPFLPANVLAPGVVIAVIFALLSFTGFEATTIYSEEVRDPLKAIPRATYIAVIGITLFYAFVSWAIICGWGLQGALDIATRNPADLFVAKSRDLLGDWLTGLMRLLILTSIISTALAFHNNLTRYMLIAARAGLLPDRFAQIHRRFQSPFQASRLQTACSAALTALFVVTDADPYEIQYGWMGALGTLGLVVLQLLVSLAVVCFFSRSSAPRRIFHTIAAPTLAAGGLAFCAWRIAQELPLLSGSESNVVAAFPKIIAIAFAVGFLYASYLRIRSPESLLRVTTIASSTAVPLPESRGEIR